MCLDSSIQRNKLTTVSQDILISMAHRRAPRINTFYFTPNDRIMFTADVLFWLSHKMLLLAKLFYWARMIFPALWMMYAAFMRHSQLTPILSVLPRYNQLGLSRNFTQKALMFKCHPDILQSHLPPTLKRLQHQLNCVFLTSSHQWMLALFFKSKHIILLSLLKSTSALRLWHFFPLFQLE